MGTCVSCFSKTGSRMYTRVRRGQCKWEDDVYKIRISPIISTIAL